MQLHISQRFIEQLLYSSYVARHMGFQRRLRHDLCPGKGSLLGGTNIWTNTYNNNCCTANTLLGTVLSALPECFYLVVHNDTIGRYYHKWTNRHCKDSGFLVQVHKLAKGSNPSLSNLKHKLWISTFSGIQNATGTKRQNKCLGLGRKQGCSYSTARYGFTEKRKTDRIPRA